MKSLILCLLMLLPFSVEANAPPNPDRYDLVCRGPLGEYHKFQNVTYDWRTYMQPDGYIQEPRMKRTYFIKHGMMCILMRRPYKED